jgi:hypothetical protein
VNTLSAKFVLQYLAEAGLLGFASGQISIYCLRTADFWAYVNGNAQLMDRLLISGNYDWIIIGMHSVTCAARSKSWCGMLRRIIVCIPAFALAKMLLPSNPGALEQAEMFNLVGFFIVDLKSVGFKYCVVASIILFAVAVPAVWNCTSRKSSRLRRFGGESTFLPSNWLVVQYAMELEEICRKWFWIVGSVAWMMLFYWSFALCSV